VLMDAQIKLEENGRAYIRAFEVKFMGWKRIAKRAKETHLE